MRMCPLFRILISLSISKHCIVLAVCNLVIPWMGNKMNDLILELHLGFLSLQLATFSHLLIRLFLTTLLTVVNNSKYHSILYSKFPYVVTLFVFLCLKSPSCWNSTWRGVEFFVVIMSTILPTPLETWEDIFREFYFNSQYPIIVGLWAALYAISALLIVYAISYL